MSLRNKKSVQHLQSKICVKVDGWWGEASQRRYVDGGFKLAVNWEATKKYFGNLNSAQKAGIELLVKTANNLGIYKGAERNPLFVAYILGTVWHETNKTMQAIEEYGKGKGRDYGTWSTNSLGTKYCEAMRDSYVYTYEQYPHLYYGRGLPQLTWLDNYLKIGKIIGVDLANNPHLALDPEISSKITIVGMMEGTFTGASLEDCITYAIGDDYIKARSIINGKDRAAKIANYADSWLACLTIV